MSGPIAFCPRCRKDTEFVEAGSVRQCSVCGQQFALAGLRSADLPEVGSAAMGVAKVLLRVVLIMIALVVVGVGVLFAGCALMLGGGHF